MEGLAQLLSAPLQSWDAVICTSEAVRAMVERQIEAQAAYLQARFGVRAELACRLPVIPLGVHCDDFAPNAGRRAAGQALRQRLGIAGGEIAGLFLGRLSFHAKANPFPMYRAMQAAAERSGRRLHLIQAGWFSNDWIESAFTEAAAVLAAYAFFLTVVVYRTITPTALFGVFRESALTTATVMTTHG